MYQTTEETSRPENPTNHSTVTAANQADLDAQLFSTLCEIDKMNYLFLFERCKACCVNARQLRYFEKEHIRELIPKSQLGILAEFEFLLNEWQVIKGFKKTNTMAIIPKPLSPKAAATSTSLPKVTISTGTLTNSIYTESRGTNTEPMELPAFTLPTTSSTFLPEELTSKDLLNSMRLNEDESQCSYMASPRACLNGEVDGGHKYPLTTIIPTVLTKCQQKYKSNRGLLTEVERRLLSGAIIDYFIGQRIHLKAHMIDDLAEQISQHFPTESKRAWYDRKNSKGRGRLYVKLYNSHRSKDKTATGKKRKMDGNSSASENSFHEEEPPEYDEEALQVQNWLKCNKCEDMNEVTNMWNDTLNYRRSQLKRIQLGYAESVAELLENWPSYKWSEGHLLLSVDFNSIHPLSSAAYRQRRPIYMTKIVTLMEAELKDLGSVQLFGQFKMARNTLNEDSCECTLINLLHAITKPSRCFTTPQGVKRFCITDSQTAVLRLVMHISEISSYSEAYPCIFAVGDSLLNVEECYVAYRDIRYKLKFSDALAACMHIYTIFRVDYPLPTLNFWRFIRGYFFDIHLEDETSYAVMDNIVKYLDNFDSCV